MNGALRLEGGGQATSYFGLVDSLSSTYSNTIEATSATITGTGSRWDTGDFATGLYSTGTTTVSSGGTVSSSYNTYVGLHTNSNGTLNINAGGTVDTNGNGYLGYSADSTGTVTVGGTDALWGITGGLYVGGDTTTSGGTGTLIVNAGGTVNAGSLTVYNGNSSISTGNTAISSTGGQINVNGALTLQGGGSATSFSGVVDSVGASSYYNNTIDATSATITGTGSRWDTGSFYTGLYSTGTTTVSSGGTVSSLYDTRVGFDDGSNGTLNINAGGTVDTNWSGYLGINAGSTGTVNVGGTDALWDIANGLYVGGTETTSGGTGNLNVNDGGVVAVAGQLKLWDNGTLAVNGGNVTAGVLNTSTNSTLNINSGTVATQSLSTDSNLLGTTTIGVAGALIADQTTINLGGSVSNGGALIATNGGTINLTSTEVTNNAVAKAINGGAFNIINGATLKGGLIEASGAGSVVDVQAGGKIESQAFVDVTVQAKNGGTLNVDGIVDGSVSIFNGGILTGSGDIIEDVTNTNGGQFNAGNSPGSMTIGGDYTQDQYSTFTFELAGTEQGTEYDWVDVGGTANLAGELEVLWYDDFTASLGDTFDILSAETIDGEFDILTLVMLGVGLEWDVSYLFDFVGSTDIVRLSVIESSAVPVPAAAWLFGSALIGLVGIKRKK